MKYLYVVASLIALSGLSLEIDGASLESSSSSSSSESSLREKRSTADDFLPCDPSNGPPCDLPMPPPKPPGMPGPPNPPESGMQPGGSQMREKRAAQGPPAGGPGPEGGMDGMMGGAVGVAGAMASTMGDAFNTGVDAMSQMGKRIGNIMSGAKM